MPRQLPHTVSTETYRKSFDYKLDKIVYFIALNGPSNKKTLERRLKIDKPTIYKAIRRLLDTKRVVIHHREMSGMVKYYELTRLGVMHAVWFGFDEAHEDASKISGLVRNLFVRYPEWLPDIASLWPVVTEVSVNEPKFPGVMTSLEALALYAVVSICEDAIGEAYRRERHGETTAKEHDPSSRFLLSWLESDDEYYTRWFWAVQGNTVLREATTRKLQERIQGLEDMARALAAGPPPRPLPRSFF